MTAAAPIPSGEVLGINQQPADTSLAAQGTWILCCRAAPDKEGVSMVG
ncbi:hypothetical protein ACIRSU_00575 [Streptomyces sp. NPDC101160]